MEKYIIITEFGDQQDIRVGLKSCKNKYNLLLCWAKHLSYPYIGIKSKTKLIEDIKFDLREFKQYVMNARSYMTNFYHESYLVNGIHIELYIVKREQNCESSFLFKIFVFYKNWILSLVALLFTAIVIIAHRENIKRLIKGEENKISLKNKKKSSSL